jgi:hypothetical protein
VNSKYICTTKSIRQGVLGNGASAIFLEKSVIRSIVAANQTSNGVVKQSLSRGKKVVEEDTQRVNITKVYDYEKERFVDE